MQVGVENAVDEDLAEDGIEQTRGEFSPLARGQRIQDRARVADGTALQVLYRQQPLGAARPKTRGTVRPAPARAWSPRACRIISVFRYSMR